MDYLQKNLNHIHEQILRTCQKIGQANKKITLIAVTKTIGFEPIKQVENLGEFNFGENKVQELISKYDLFEKNIQWHLIGNLQTNKVKYIIDKVVLIHSVCSFKLAFEINKKAKEKNIIMDILIEINIACEDSKNGILQENLFSFIEQLNPLENICIKGLMTVAPFVENPEDNRIHFKNMYLLYEKMKQLKNSNISISTLSMGMTNDYLVAIEEGANMVRIGTGIFGKRN